MRPLKLNFILINTCTTKIVPVGHVAKMNLNDSYIEHRYCTAALRYVDEHCIIFLIMKFGWHKAMINVLNKST